jgi:hypothetical protein
LDAVFETVKVLLKLEANWLSAFYDSPIFYKTKQMQKYSPRNSEIERDKQNGGYRDNTNVVNGWWVIEKIEHSYAHNHQK